MWLCPSLSKYVRIHGLYTTHRKLIIWKVSYCMGIPNLSHSVMPAYVMQDNTMYHMCVYYRLACKYILIVTQSTVHCIVLLGWQLL